MSEPLLYEINTRCWLRDLSEAASRPITLAEVPESEFLTWQSLGFTHIWLMGVWTGGPRARAQALNNTGLARAYSDALPGWTEADVGASPYSIAAYRVPANLGGDEGLKEFRRKLRGFGLKLILDFVPNHLGLDHPWVKDRTELFVTAPSFQPETFAEETTSGRRCLVFGKDPNCPCWTDTVQLDYRRAETRTAMITLLLEIANFCDGVRCDMAMLLLNDVFANTWRRFPISEPGPTKEFWSEAIATTRRGHPDFLFLAEVYWGLEARLQSLGFDYTYDKVLYDLLLARTAGETQRHLLLMPSQSLAASVHFLENHDEARIASLLSPPEHRAAALAILGLPGMRLIYEGQLSGARRRLPVQLLRRTREPKDPAISEIYSQTLAAVRNSGLGQSEWVLLAAKPAWAFNPTAQHFVLVQWTRSARAFDLVVVNLAPHRAQCFAPLKLPSTQVNCWKLTDLLGTDRFVRDSQDLINRGLFLDLPAHGAQILHFEPE